MHDVRVAKLVVDVQLDIVVALAGEQGKAVVARAVDAVVRLVHATGGQELGVFGGAEQVLVLVTGQLEGDVGEFGDAVVDGLLDAEVGDVDVLDLLGGDAGAGGSHEGGGEGEDGEGLHFERILWCCVEEIELWGGV